MKYNVGDKLEINNYFKGNIEIIGIIPIGSRNNNVHTIYTIKLDDIRIDIPEPIVSSIFCIPKQGGFFK